MAEKKSLRVRCLGPVRAPLDGKGGDRRRTRAPACCSCDVVGTDIAASDSLRPECKEQLGGRGARS